MAQRRHKLKEKVRVCLCCVCGQARDDIDGSRSWRSLSSFKIRHRFRDNCLFFVHTFCPTCSVDNMRLLGLDTA